MVELIVVIVVVAIMSLYAASQFIGVSKFSAQAAQEQGISVIRQIQLGRMQSNLDESETLHERHSLLVSANCLGSVQACTDTSDRPHSHRVIIQEQDMSFEPAMQVEFDLLGNPSCSSGCTTPVAGQEIRINVSSESETETICINSQGYVYGC
ncbi:MSHA pilin protein mshC [Vibrio ishigakensis]|uniref:MSHA pilin protein mshC n=1 Tax=Vibrio ishigakensis TaxID=1481914 RepID=A0A0B8PE33_9VIBR|nr:MSHA pilin protein mshC [Vibrio ishigakensis]